MTQASICTASFMTSKGMPGRISTALFPPRFIKATEYKTYRPLAPGRWFKTASPREYIERYFNEVLRPLDPQQVYDELWQLAGGATPILLCYEKPPFSVPDRWWEQDPAQDHKCDFGNWCHRRIIAAWFKDGLGVDCLELV